MHYRVYLDDQQEWRWAFRTSTHKTIAVSKRGYPHKRGMPAIDPVGEALDACPDL